MTAGDAVARRLASLADRWRAQLTGVSTVGVDAAGGSITPSRDGAVAVSWADLGDRFEVQVHAPGGGGRFPTTAHGASDLDLVEELVDAVVGGHAGQVVARHRCRVEVRLATGVVRDSGEAAGTGRWPARVTRTDFRAHRGR